MPKISSQKIQESIVLDFANTAAEVATAFGAFFDARTRRLSGSERREHGERQLAHARRC